MSSSSSSRKKHRHASDSHNEESDVSISKQKKRKDELVVSDERPVDKKLRKARKELSSEEQDKVVAEAEKLLSKVSPTDQDNLEEYIHMFQKLRLLIRKYEDMLMEKPNSRDVYALSTLYSQQREVIADIRTMSDLSAQAQTLVEDMLSPFSRNMVQGIADMYFAIRKLLIETVPKENVQFTLSHLDTLTKDMGRAVDVHRSAAAKKINDILLGPSEFESKPKRKIGHRR